MSDGNSPRYTLRRSARSIRLSVAVQPTGEVVVTAPLFAAMRAIERFVAEHASWIQRTVAKTARYRDDVFLPRTHRQYLIHKPAARALVQQLLAAHAPRIGVPYGRVAIKNTTRNWGSCSELGNLNFNYKLVFLPPHLAEYVVVHELCHLRHFDHSDAFWDAVAAILPTHKALRKELRRYHA